MADDLRSAASRKTSFLGTIKAVGASFFGVRGSRAHRADVSRLNPIHVVIAGVLLAICFVVFLLFVVQLVIK
ncbi:MAG TPA: DUF2970 domain-containing protein [Burkholderiaceae bacterium]|nr:DUF2970 domain-containing protein [Burkholderiaceae bacterium]